MTDYHLYELGSSEFEYLTIQICNKILGIGTINFSEGKDGGRDGKFEGTAENYPSKSSPWSGKFIIQSKCTHNPISSCSDTDFKTNILDKEFPKIKKLIKSNEIDNYLIFTNRKLSANTYADCTKYIKTKTKLKNVEIFGVEKIHSLLDSNPDIVKTCNLERFRNPLRIHPEDIRDLIKAFYSNREKLLSEFKSRYCFKYVDMDSKNKLNKLSESYFSYIKESSESYFNAISLFLKKLRNKIYTEYYYNTVDELKGKIKVRRSEFAEFERIFEHLYDAILDKFPDLRKSRRLINVFLHYMYCNCDIGEK